MIDDKGSLGYANDPKCKDSDATVNRYQSYRRTFRKDAIKEVRGKVLVKVKVEGRQGGQARQGG
jgi:hypothetical protein